MCDIANGYSVDHVRRVVIGLGANLGDRAASIRRAMDELGGDRDLIMLRKSPLYESPPAGGPPQGDYLNAAVVIVTSLEARDLLDRLLDIERRLGRTRPDAVRWGPRVIDLDLLWIEGEAVDEPGLCVPHARLLERAFALRPLLDVAPDAADPRTNERLSECEIAKAELRTYSGSE